MNSDWQRVQLGEAADLLVGFAFKSAGFTPGPDGVRLLRGDNVAQGALRWNGAKHWPSSSADDYSAYALAQDDVVIAMDRPWIEAGLKYARVKAGDLPCLLVQRVARLRARPPMCQEFLQWLIGSPSFTEHVLSVQTGTAVPHISGSQISSFVFPMPPLDEQRRIAGVLGALDDKIEHNRQLADRLSQLVAKRFRAQFPEVLGDERLVEHVDVVRGRSYKSEELSGSERALVTLKSFKRGGGYAREGLKPYSGDFKPEQVIQPGEVVIAHTDLTQSADVIGKPALVPDTDVFTCLVASLDLAIVRPKSDRVSRLFLYYLFLSDEFQAHAYAHSNGSTVLHLSKDAIPSFEVLLPDTSQREAFDAFGEPLVQKSIAMEQERRAFVSIRDLLLPRLVSGSIRVPDSYDPDDVLGTVAEEAAAA